MKKTEYDFGWIELRAGQSWLAQKLEETDTAERLAANEADAGLALVINMNHGVVPLEPPWDRKEVTYGKKGRDQGKKGCEIIFFLWES